MVFDWISIVVCLINMNMHQRLTDNVLSPGFLRDTCVI